MNAVPTYLLILILFLRRLAPERLRDGFKYFFILPSVGDSSRVRSSSFDWPGSRVADKSSLNNKEQLAGQTAQG